MSLHDEIIATDVKSVTLLVEYMDGTHTVEKIEVGFGKEIIIHMEEKVVQDKTRRCPNICCAI